MGRSEVMKGSGTRRRVAPAVLSARMEEISGGWMAIVYVNGVQVSWAEGAREDVLEQLRRAGVQTVIWPPAPISILRVTGHSRREDSFASQKPRRRNE